MNKQGVSLEERGLLTLAALNHLDQGITVFDRNLELVTWNQYFIDLLDFPEALTRVGTHIEVLFRFNASRGEYGPGDPEEQVKERLLLAARLESHCFERIRPNGQIIEIQGSPLEGGGFVSIYTDITARRHAEEALRENRDLLEQRVKSRTSALFDLNQALKQEIFEHREAQQALLESQKLNAMGQLTGGIAHDFNNLLTIIQGNLDLIEIDTIRDNEICESLRAAKRAAKRGADLTRHLLAFARRQSLEPTSVGQEWVTTEIGELLHRTLGESINLEIIATTHNWNVLADPVQLENAILNLAINARDAMPDGGDLVIRIKNITLEKREDHLPETVPPGDYILFIVEDSGVGIEADVLEHACEPFFTTKEMGTGLGLSTVYGFARQSGGWFNLTSDPETGTQATLAMPRASGKTKQETDSYSALLPRSSGEHILVVEDDSDVRSFTCRALLNLGYRVSEAADSNAALQIAQASPSIKMLLTDLVMPGGTSGISLAKTIRHNYPDIKVLCMSGYPEKAMKNNPISNLNCALLRKPFTQNQLACAVREVFEQQVA